MKAHAHKNVGLRIQADTNIVKYLYYNIVHDTKLQAMNNTIGQEHVNKINVAKFRTKLNNKIWEYGQTYLLPNIQHIKSRPYKLQARIHFSRHPCTSEEVKKSECLFWSIILLMCSLEHKCGNPETLVCAQSAATILINTIVCKL